MHSSYHFFTLMGMANRFTTNLQRALGFPVQSFAKQEKELGILRGRSLLAISLKGDRGGRGCKKSLISSLPEGTLCYSEGDIQHFCQDSLCLPRDPALATRSLLEEGEFSPRDLLILDNQGHVLSKAGELVEDVVGKNDETLIDS